MRNTILIVYPWSGIDTNPTMLNLVHGLLEHWDAVRILCPHGDIPVRRGHPRDAPLPPATPRSILNPVRPSGALCRQRAGRLVRRAAFALEARTCAAVIGVDPYGLVLAGQLNRWAQRPLAYVSFEILFDKEIRQTAYHLTKQEERDATRRAGIVLVQDEERGDVLAGLNDIPRDRLAYVPNAPHPQTIPESDYLRQRLGIPPERRIVLYAGALAAWASRDLLADMAACWPERFCLVIHTCAEPDTRGAEFLEMLTRTGRIFVSTEPLPVGELPHLYASADFGLAPYRPTPDDWTSGKNIYHIGLASGKVAWYALCGLPILTTNLPAFSGIFAEFQCGAAYTNIGETGELLERLDQNYGHHSRECVRFYNERLDPTEPMRRFCQRLREFATA